MKEIQKKALKESCCDNFVNNTNPSLIQIKKAIKKAQKLNLEFNKKTQEVYSLITNYLQIDDLSQISTDFQLANDLDTALNDCINHFEIDVEDIINFIKKEKEKGTKE